MNIDKHYAWQSGANKSRENNPLLPRNVRGPVIGKSGCGKTTAIFNLSLQPNWLDYNHLYVFGKSLYQQEYKVLQKGFEAGLSKQQISNVFANSEALRVANISPPTAIDTFSGARNGKIKTDFYDDRQNIPDPLALEPMQKNLLLLDDCFVGKQHKAEAYYTRGGHNNCDTIYIAQNYFHLPRRLSCSHKNLTNIHADHCASDISLSEFKQFYHGVWSCGAGHNAATIDLTSTPMNGKYRQNFNRFYFAVNLNREYMITLYI